MVKSFRPAKELRLPPGNRRGSNCGVTAIAIAAQVHFREVWDHVAAYKPASWGGSVNEDDLVRAFRFFGVHYRSRIYDRSVTIGHWAGTSAKPGVLYVLDVWNHVAVFKDGFIFDQRGRHFTVMEKGHWKIERVYEIRRAR
jgi:hypothetical protein